MDYSSAAKIRKKSFGTLLAEQEGGLGSSLKSTISQKTQANIAGLKETFDPMNIAKKMTFGSNWAPAMLGKLTGRKAESIAHFTGARLKNRKLGRSAAVNDNDDSEVAPTPAIESVKAIHKLLKTREKQIKTWNKNDDKFDRAEKKEELKRHNELLKALSLKRVKIKEEKQQPTPTGEQPKPTKPAEPTKKPTEPTKKPGEPAKKPAEPTKKPTEPAKKQEPAPKKQEPTPKREEPAQPPKREEPVKREEKPAERRQERDNKKQEDRQRAEREKAERERLEKEKAAKDKAEKDRLAKEKADKERAEKEAREAKEKADREAREAKDKADREAREAREKAEAERKSAERVKREEPAQQPAQQPTQQPPQRQPAQPPRKTETPTSQPAPRPSTGKPSTATKVGREGEGLKGLDAAQRTAAIKKELAGSGASSALAAGIMLVAAKETRAGETLSEEGPVAYKNTWRNMESGKSKIPADKYEKIKSKNPNAPQSGPGAGTAYMNFTFGKNWSSEQWKSVIEDPDPGRFFEAVGYKGGEKYKGRSLIGITHKDTYEVLGKFMGLDLVNNPELINRDVKTTSQATLAYLALLAANSLNPKLTTDQLKAGYQKGLNILNSYEDPEDLKKALILLTAGKGNVNIADVQQVRGAFSNGTNRAAYLNTQLHEGEKMYNVLGISQENAQLKSELNNQVPAPTVVNNTTVNNVTQTPGQRRTRPDDSPAPDVARGR